MAYRKHDGGRFDKGRKRPQRRLEPPTIGDQALQAIIHDGDAEKLNLHAIELGKYYSLGNENERLSSSQIRSVLDQLQRMPGWERKTLQLLRPKLAYAAGRHRGKVMDLQKVTDRAICLVESEEQFENFKNFFEAIVAYHRYHGGK
ncbi:MAG: type III-A CRISPR-associated protein Csm2 [Desulfobacterales bacterium]|nr:type III-A CRISPR-associated protein Csm2 [Desulfobacterales bacterium]